MEQGKWNCKNCHKSLLEAKEKEDGSLSCPHCGLIIYAKTDLWENNKKEIFRERRNQDKPEAPQMAIGK